VLVGVIRGVGRVFLVSGVVTSCMTGGRSGCVCTTKGGDGFGFDWWATGGGMLVAE